MFRPSWLKSLFTPRPTTIRRAERRPAFRLEALETRVVPASTVTQSAGTLVITGDTQSDTITVTEMNTRGQFRVVTTDDQGGAGTTQTFSNVTSIIVRAGGGAGDDTVTFDAESESNSFGLTGTLTVNGSGSSLTVNVNDNVNVRGTTTVNYVGGGTLEVSITGTSQQGGTGGIGGIGGSGGTASDNDSIHLGAVSINNGSTSVSSGGQSGDSTVTIGPAVRLNGGLSLNLANGDDAVTINQASIRGGVTAALDAGGNRLTITESAITGGVSYTSNGTGGTGGGTGQGGDGIQITGSSVGGAVRADLRGSDEVGSVVLTGTTVRSGLTVFGGNQADVVALTGVTIRGPVTLGLRDGSGDGSQTGAEAGTNVTITGGSRIAGDVNEAGIGNLNFTLDGDSRVDGNVTLSATGGSDASTVTIGSAPSSGLSAGGAARITKNLRFTGGSGGDTVTLNRALIEGSAILSLGALGSGQDAQTGGSTLTLNGAFIKGDLIQTATNGGSFGFTMTGNSWVVGSVGLRSSTSGGLTATFDDHASIGGSLTITGGSGDDTVTLDGEAAGGTGGIGGGLGGTGAGGLVSVGRGVAMNLGNGTADVTMNAVSVVGGFAFTSGTASNGNNGNNGGQDAVTMTLTDVGITNGISVTARGGDDTITFARVTTGSTATTIATGDGNDEIDISDSDFDGAFSLDTGAGDDTVLIEAPAAGASGTTATLDTVFRSGFSLRTGDGGDTVTLGTDEANEAVFFGSATFAGTARGSSGSNTGGDDTIDRQFAEFLGNDPTFSGFQQP